MNPRTTTRTRDFYPPATWLRKLTSKIYGEYVPHLGRPLPEKSRQEAGNYYNSQGYFPGLNNTGYRSHAKGTQTYYFMGNEDPRAESTLVMIDIDVMKSNQLGSTAGAVAFASYLKNHYFPALYHEPSTGGKGVHAYLVLKKVGLAATIVNDILKGFERWLTRRAAGFDLELVEVKGSCPVLTFDPTTYRKIAHIKYGTMAKLPRNLDAAFEALKNTTALHWHEMLQLPEVDHPCSVRNDVARSSQQLVIKKGGGSRSGSISGKHISEDDLECLPRFRSIAQKYMGAAKLQAGRHIVTAEDFAIAFLLMRFFKKDRNEDGSLPTARVQKLWEALRDSGDVTRPWNHHRWKVIRDSMSMWGLLAWTDNKYEPGQFVGEKWQKGQACRFEVTEEFFQVLEGGGYLVDTSISIDPFFLRPVLVWTLKKPECDKIDRYIRWAEVQLEYRLAA